MSNSTNRNVEVKNILGSFGASELANDRQVVGQRLRVVGQDWIVLDWEGRYFLNDQDLLKDPSIDPKETTVKLDSGLEFSFGRFRDLACWEPKVVFGPGVKTGEYRPILAWLGLEGLRVRRVKKPKWLRGDAEVRVWLQGLREWLKAPTSLFATCDEEGVSVVERVLPDGTLAQRDQMGSLVSEAGFTFTEAGKLDKRAKPISSLFGYCVRLALADLQVTFVEGVSDGALRVSRDLALLLSESKDSWHHGRGKHAKAWSIRLYGPQGLIKGVAVVDESLEGLQVVTDVENLKRGVCYGKGWVVAGEPKKAKDFSRLHVQYAMTHDWVFGQEPIEDCIFTECYEVFNRLVEGTMDVQLETCVAAMTGRCETRKEESAYLESLWAAFRWQHLGLKLKNSWGLSEFVFRSHTEFLRDWREGDLSPKLPCTLRCQIFNDVFAESAGLVDGPVGDDEVRVVGYDGSGKYPCVVVSKARFAEMAPVHGTMDEDDDVDVFFRTVAGKKKVLILRTPCGPGEYTLLDFVEGDFSPTTTLYHWNEERSTVTPRTVSFPVLTAECPPTRSGQAEIPNRLGESAARTTHTYGVAWVLESARRAATAPGIGSLSNLLMCWAAAHDGEGPTDQLAELSDVIDVAQSGGDPRQAKMLEDWLNQHWLALDAVVASDYIREFIGVDPMLWNRRAKAKAWDDKAKKLVDLGYFTQDQVETHSAWWKSMQYADRVLELFMGNRKTRKQGKLQTWLGQHFETHPVFAVLAQDSTPEDLMLGESQLKSLRREMADIEAEYEVKHQDSKAVVLAKTEARKEAYKALDLRVEQVLLTDGLLVPVAVAVYRSQSQRHRDGMLFANRKVQKAFLDVLEEAMPLWLEEEELTRKDLAETRKVAASLRPF